MPIAWWILNHKKYDPDYDPAKWESVFRDNILNVTDDKIEAYLSSIKEDKLNLKDTGSVIMKVPIELRQAYFFVDFDTKTFINGFFDIEVEEYLPDQHWKGEAGNPVNYFPGELKRIIES